MMEGGSKSKSSWNPALKILITILSALLALHFHYVEIVEKTNTFEQWWVWELAVEGVVNTPAPVSWKVADNSEVIEAIYDSKQPYQPTYQQLVSNETSHQDTFAIRTKAKTMERKDKTKTRRIKSVKKILFVSKQDYQRKKIDEKLCGGKCEVSHNAAQFHEADAVVFDNQMLDKVNIPHRKDFKQLFVWMNNISPYCTQTNVKGEFAKFNTFFNMTMTHRRDSDIYFPTYTVQEILNQLRDNPYVPSHKHLKRIKTKFVYWEPKSCGDTKVAMMALDVVYQLVVAGLAVDLKGKCWNEDKTVRLQRPFQENSRYKFYLAFGYEWHCRDFIDTDVWEKGFLTGAVPVIWGPKREDIMDLLPRGSYILAEDFASAFELANYLEYLDSEDLAYWQYHLWREKPLKELLINEKMFRFQRLNGFCQLCSILHSIEPSDEHFVPSVDEWWLENESVSCNVRSSPSVNEMLNYHRQYTLLGLEIRYLVLSACATYKIWCCFLFLIIFVIFYYQTVWNCLPFQSLATLAKIIFAICCRRCK